MCTINLLSCCHRCVCVCVCACVCTCVCVAFSTAHRQIFRYPHRHSNPSHLWTDYSWTRVHSRRIQTQAFNRQRTWQVYTVHVQPWRVLGSKAIVSLHSCLLQHNDNLFDCRLSLSRCFQRDLSGVSFEDWQMDVRKAAGRINLSVETKERRMTETEAS